MLHTGLLPTKSEIHHACLLHCRLSPTEAPGTEVNYAGSRREYIQSTIERRFWAPTRLSHPSYTIGSIIYGP